MPPQQAYWGWIWEITRTADPGTIFDLAVLSSGSTLSESQEELLIFTIAPLMVLLVLGFFAYGSMATPIKRMRQYLGMESFDPAMAASEDGLVGVKGTARTAEDTVTGPHSEEGCVAYEYERQRYTYDYKYDRNERAAVRSSTTRDDDPDEKVWQWKTVESERGSVPFLVETDHGPVEVEPDDAVLDLPTQSTESTSGLRRALYTINPLNKFPFSLLNKLTVFNGASGDRPEREFESHIVPGDEVLVIGAADAAQTDDEAVGTVSGGADLYKITTRSRLRLVLGALFSSLTGVFLLLIGLLLAGVIVYVGISDGIY